MHGVGPPLVTPFTADGDVDHDRLTDLVDWVEARGVDFLVPCGSTSEAELMSVQERAAVVETVVEAASVPVVAGTGHPGRRETVRQTALAADSGADAALVVTPFYYPHSQVALTDYYHEVADAAEIPIFLYSVPVFTGVALEPATVGALAGHPTIAGLKDSSGDLERLQRERTRTAEADFDLLVGSGSIFASALAAGATGGILALANIAPEGSAAIYDRHEAGDTAGARAANEALVELNWTITSRYGIPGLKAAMRMRDAPAGHPRSPHQPVDDDARDELESLIGTAESIA